MNERQRLERQLDSLWRLLVLQRAENKCEKCGSRTDLESHHIVSRYIRATRWELRNGICLCKWNCHRLPHSLSVKDRRWYKQWELKYIGKMRMRQLELMARELEHYSPTALEDKLKGLKGLLAGR